MPDLKFKDGKFYFSLLSPYKTHPLLLPVITNPEFATNKRPVGIKELIYGDLGITELILLPLIEQSMNTISSFPLLEQNVNKEDFINSYIPKDMGLKAIEKTVISAMMENHKPLIDFLKILIEVIGVSEDVFCRFLGTSVKVFGKEIGFPSRKPQFWSKELNYTETMTYSLSNFLKATEEVDNLYNNMSNNNPLKNNIPNGSEKIQGIDTKESYYVAYFDEEGNDVEPPKWILNSKWFKKEVKDSKGNIQTITAPFKQLSTEMYEGVEQLIQLQQKEIDKLINDKNNTLSSIDDRIKSAQKIEDETLRKNEIDSLNSEKKQASELFDNLITNIKDVLEGTNKGGNNYIDPNDTTKGVNPPTYLSDWVSKTKSAQLRQRYYPEQISTVQTIIDKDGNMKEPYVNIPKVDVNYKGRNIKVETPLAFNNQITRKKVTSKDTFFESIEGKGKKRYSNLNVVSSLNLYEGTNKDKPFDDNESTHFSRNIKKEYIPDNVKNYFLPFEWQEVYEYAIRNKRTKEIVRTEREFVNFKIDLESDYDLRLIKVINRPLAKNGINEEFFTENNIKENTLTTNLTSEIPSEYKNILSTLSISEIKQRVKNGTLKQDILRLIDDKNGFKFNFYSSENISKLQKDIDTTTGTLFTDGSNIPLDSTPNINDLNEGIIYQGLDPRFVHQTKYKVFWLVEAIKKDKSNTNINNSNTNNTNSNNDSDKWYGLFDKLNALPQITTKLLPLISTKMIPMIVKFIELVSNPTKIKEFLLKVGIENDDSMFAQNFSLFNSTNRKKQKDLQKEKIPKNLDEKDASPSKSTKTHYMGVQEGVDNPKPISAIDGQTMINFANIVNIGIELENGEYKAIDKIDEKKKPHTIFNFVLNMLKLPFEIILKIFKWVMNWVVKLLNPINIPSAINELLSFKWLKDILGKDSIFNILGLKDFDATKLVATDNGQSLFDKKISSFRGDSSNLIEVLIYDILQNGKKIRTETITRPYTGNSDSNTVNSNNTVNANSNNTNSNNTDNANSNNTNSNTDFCGIRFFNIQELVPIPFLPKMPSFNACETPQIFLKPLEMITGFLKFVQEIINSFLSMPIAILGLEPTIPIPKFGKEIPFANVLEDLLNKLRNELQQISMI